MLLVGRITCLSDTREQKSCRALSSRGECGRRPAIEGRSLPMKAIFWGEGGARVGDVEDLQGGGDTVPARDDGEDKE
ncbi:hypothetical protein L1987_58349 [Smallanthus sonchifolius]|uniref:Uncharacterized protein n=1 Tax=Smallanthus sonchifolius TaxID=185202 RepID=A0ACB9DG49_9ASTR|nr:hypothetical protein L1987_58349 [Smallanthus sonchifolius]